MHRIPLEQRVIGPAIAVIIGGKANAMVTTVVDGILMPISTFLTPDGAWRKAMVDLGPIRFLVGPVIGTGIDFLTVAWLVFDFSKKALKKPTVAKKSGATSSGTRAARS